MDEASTTADDRDDMNVPYDPTHPVYEGRVEAVIVPATGTFIVVDGVVTEDPDPEQLREAFGCVRGCR